MLHPLELTGHSLYRSRITRALDARGLIRFVIQSGNQSIRDQDS